MNATHSSFDEHHVLHKLKHYLLAAQAQLRCSQFDRRISIWNFPVNDKIFISSIRGWIAFELLLEIDTLSHHFNAKRKVSGQWLKQNLAPRNIYLSGIAPAGVLGFLCLRWLTSREAGFNPDQCHGHSYKHPGMAFIFLSCCLAASGFLISPTFTREDLMFTHIREVQALFTFFASLSFIIDGLAIIRIYARKLLGPNVKSAYDMAYRSS